MQHHDSGDAHSRFSRLTSSLNSLGAELAIATTRENFFWLTGCDPVGKVLNPHRPGWFALYSGRTRETAVAMPLSESDQILDMPRKPDHVAFYGTFYREQGDKTELTAAELDLLAFHNEHEHHKSWLDALVAVTVRLAPLPTAVIAIDEDGLNTTAFASTKTALSAAGFQVVEAAAGLRRSRAVKTSLEIELLRTGASIGLSSYAHAAARAKEGVKETDLRAFFENELIANGAHPRLSMIRIGRNAVFGQRHQRQDIVWSRSELLWFDCDFTYRGYWIDVARTFLPQTHPRGHLLYRAMMAGQTHAINSIRPGMTGADVFSLTVQKVRDEGCPHYRRQHVGHGIGLEPYEPPILSPVSTDIIEAGNVICIEAPYYEFGLGALHVEDLVLIGENENTVLRPDYLSPSTMQEAFQ